jgi:hypothetical protein
MTPITLELPDELARRWTPHSDEMPRIVELGLRQLEAEVAPRYSGTAEVLEFLAGLPAPDEILALRPSKQLQARAAELLERNRANGLTPEERREMDHYQYLEQLVRRANLRAQERLTPP